MSLKTCQRSQQHILLTLPKNLDLTAMYNNVQILLVIFYKNLATVSQNLKEILIESDQPPLPHATSFPSLGSLFGRNGKSPVKLKYGFSYLCLPSLAPLGFCGHTVNLCLKNLSASSYFFLLLPLNMSSQCSSFSLSP